MASITITVDATAATEELARTRGVLKATAAINSVTAQAGAETVRAHLLGRNSRSQRANYWSKAAEATTAESDATRATVVIRHPGVAWHRYGGTITARDGGAMTIPLRDEVRGIWPSEFDPSRTKLFVWRRRPQSDHNGKAFLAIREGKALRILYLLLKSVTKSKDPSVLPTNQQTAESAADAIRQLIHLHRQRQEQPHG